MRLLRRLRVQVDGRAVRRYLHGCGRPRLALLHASEQLLDECILIGLAGWRNISDRRGRPIPFQPASETLDQALTLVEKWEIANNYPAALQNAEIEMRRPRPSGPRIQRRSGAPKRGWLTQSFSVT